MIVVTAIAVVVSAAPSNNLATKLRIQKAQGFEIYEKRAKHRHDTISRTTEKIRVFF